MSTQATGSLLLTKDFPDGLKTTSDVQRLGNLVNPLLKAVAQLTAQGVNVAQNLDAQEISFQLTTPSTDFTDFTPATWTNVGAPYSAFGWRTDAAGVTWLRMAITTLPALTTTLATLPAAAAPVADQVFTAIANGAFGAVQVASDGAVTQVAGSVAAGLTLFCSFPSASNAPAPLSCFPQKARIADRRVPLTVLLTSIADHSQAAAATPTVLAPGVQWSYLAGALGQPNLISIDGIPGLALGRTYDITLLVVFE